jgi:hypothetical protein
MSRELTLADVKSAMPLRKGAITQEAVDIINASQNDPEFQGESLVQTAGIYESVLKGARASVPEYLNAIRFCAYMSTNDSNYTEAYKKVFSNRDFVQQRINLPTNDPRYGELTSDRINAAKELLAATKGPDNMKIELDVGVSESSAVQQLNDQLAEIAGRSLKHLEAGSTNLKELGAMKVTSDDILEGEFKQND